MHLESDITNNMDMIDMFERRISDYTGFKHAVCVDCCTNGILVSLEMKKRLGLIDKSKELTIPSCTYMSVPMTLLNNGWKITLNPIEWYKTYEIGDTKVFDSATDFKEFMRYDYSLYENPIVCVSFQQKKRLSLGRGGAILLDDDKMYFMLKRMIHDGRNSHLSKDFELENNSDDIILGYHCYLEPEKAANGILLLNQTEMLKPYEIHSWKEYPDLRKLRCLT